MSTSTRLRVGLLAGLVVALVMAAVLAPVDAWIQMLLQADNWRSPRGLALFILIYIVWNFALPPAPLQWLAGLHYGIAPGLLVIVVATSAANILSHGVGRSLGRRWLSDCADKYDRLKAIETAVTRMGWKAIALLRLSNLIPSNIANVLMGLTPLKLSTILWASILGSLPGWALMLGLGRGGRALIDADRHQPYTWLLYLGGAAAALLLLALIGRRAKKILTDPDHNHDPDHDHD